MWILITLFFVGLVASRIQRVRATNAIIALNKRDKARK